MSDFERLIDANITDAEDHSKMIRPDNLRSFVGQHKLKNNLEVFIQAAKSRGETLDHILFYGPPGLGKTTLSQIISREMGVGFKATSGPMLTKTGDLAAILTNLQAHDVLFIDEIHRLHSNIEELLYPAMEDYSIDVIIGEGPAARSIKIDLPKFTLVGATTRLGLLTNPLRDRFGIPLKLDFYNTDELVQVIQRLAPVLNAQIEDSAARNIAERARGTPRVAIRLFKRIRDFADYSALNIITATLVQESLFKLEVDSKGLDKMDYNYIEYLTEHYKGGPVGLDTIAAGLSEDRGTIEDTIEPYLIQIGFLLRTPKGRVLTHKCLEHVGRNINPRDQLL